MMAASIPVASAAPSGGDVGMAVSVNNPVLVSGNDGPILESDYNTHDLLVQWITGGNGSVNNSESGYDEAFQYPLSLLVPTTFCYILIFILGILGNVVTCIIIKKNKSMHTATNYYLFNLAISDLLLLVSGMPLDLYNMWIHTYPFGTPVCMSLGMISETSANATVLTITSFTVERYIAICHPFRQHMMDLNRAIKFILAIWLVSFCLAIPQFIQIGVVEDHGTFMCTIKNKLIDYTFELSSFVFFVGPMIVICALYILIGLKLHRSKLLHGVKRKGCSDTSTSKSNGGGGSSNGSSGQTRVIRMLVAVVVAFFLCWCPFHAQRLMAVNSAAGDVASKWQIYVILNQCSGILYFLSTCINPLLYNIMSHKFRDAFKTTIARQLYFGNRKDKQHNYSVISRRREVMGKPFRYSQGHSGGVLRTPPMENRLSLIENSREYPVGDALVCSSDRTREDVGRIIVETSYHENGEAPRTEVLRPYRMEAATGIAAKNQTAPLMAMTTATTGAADKTPKIGSTVKKKGALLSCFPNSKKTIFYFKSPKKDNGSVPGGGGALEGMIATNTATTTTTTTVARLQKLTSVDSANTISNSSLQEVDEEEFNSSDLVKYMEEINQGIKC